MREFLAGAQTVRVQLQTPWRTSWAWLMPRLRAEVLDSGHRVLPLQTECTQGWLEGSLKFALTFSIHAVASHAAFSIRLLNAESLTVLAEVSFACLDRDTLMNELRIHRFEPYAWCGRRRIVTQRLHSGLRRVEVSVEVQLADAEHRSFFAQIPARAIVTLVGPSGHSAWRTELQFVGQSFRWNVPLTEALPLIQDHPGEYELTLVVEKHPLGRLPLTVRSEHAAYAMALEQIEAQATWEKGDYKAINHRGKIVPLDVLAEDFQQLMIAGVIEVPQLDELFEKFRLPLAVKLRNLEGQGVICQQILDPSLNPGLNPLRIPVPLQPHQFRVASSDCRLEIHLGNRLLGTVPVTHKTRRKINEEKTARLLESLSLATLTLEVERDGELVTTDNVFATDQRLNPRFTASATGFDEDVSRLELQLSLQIRHVASGLMVEQTHRLRIREGINRCHRLSVPLENIRASLPPGRCTFSLCCARRTLAYRDFRFLAEDEIVPFTQQMVLANLRVLDQRLECVSRDQSYPTQLVPFCIDTLRVCFTLQSEGFNTALPQWTVPLELKLTSAQIGANTVCQTKITLSSGPTVLNLPFSTANTPLAGRSGRYQIEIHLSGQEIARIHFRIVSEAEIIEKIEVPSFEMRTVRQHRGVLVPCTQLIVQEHRELQVTFGLRAGIPAPGFALPGRFEILADERVLFSSDFFSPLNQETTLQELKPLRAIALWAKAGRRDQTLHVRVCIGGISKWREPLELRLKAFFANFEGALVRDANAMGNVDDEYEEILQALRQ